MNGIKIIFFSTTQWMVLLIAHWISHTTSSRQGASTTTRLTVARSLYPNNRLFIRPDTIQNRPSSKLVIAHRGASYHLPEHTLAAYRLGLELGADCIEPDLVSTQDGILIALHTMDLNTTTNIMEIFGTSREPWYSESMGRTGYWSFNYTWEELQLLTVRQRIPTSRSRAYDDVFHIPSLAQILELLYDWNTKDLVARYKNNETLATTKASDYPTPTYKYRSGIYIEFKEADWVHKDAGIDSVEILFQSIAHALDGANNDQIGNSSIQDKHWVELFPNFKMEHFDEYIVPGLILQSFKVTDLQRFHEKWVTLQQHSNRDDTEPPYVLLVTYEMCWTEKFWNIVTQHRSLLSGIGCDKACLLDPDHPYEVNSFRTKVKQFDLVLHPWTQRPEQEYITMGFDSNDQEIEHLLCNIPEVYGIFTESVDAVLRVVCEDINARGSSSFTHHTEAKTTVAVCHDNGKYRYLLWTGTISFIVGIGMTLIGGNIYQRRQLNNQRQPPPRTRQTKSKFGRSTMVPTIDDYDGVEPSSELELS